MNATAEIRKAAAAWVARCDAGLSAEERESFDCWRRSDSRHEAAFVQCESAWRALATPLRAGAADELEKELAQLAARRGRRRGAGLAIAMTLIVVLISGVVMRRPQPEAGGIPSTATILRPQVRTLPDGSRVELDAGAEIAVRFEQRVRRVALLRGEAHFSVEKDTTRPFIVLADGVEIRAVGTVFNVQLASAGVGVIVTEGTVAVEKSDGTAPLALVTAGQQVEVPRATPVAVSVKPLTTEESTERLAWRGARVEFTRTPLPEAVGLLNRFAPAGSPLLVATDPALTAIRVTGVFRPDNIGGFVRLMEAGFGVEAERADGTITLRPTR